MEKLQGGREEEDWLPSVLLLLLVLLQWPSPLPLHSPHNFRIVSDIADSENAAAAILRVKRDSVAGPASRET